VQFDPMQNLPQPKIKSGKMICLRPKKDFIEFNAVAPDHLEVHYLAPDKSDLIQIASDAQALLIPAVGPKISNDLFSKTSIKFVQVTGAGIDRLDRKFCQDNEIIVCNVQGGSAFAVAEFCLAAAIVLSRHLNLGQDGIKNGQYDQTRKKMIANKMISMQGQTVGVIGFGTIGRETARLFRSIGCSVLCFDSFQPSETEAAAVGANISDLHSLLQTADIVSIHVPLSEQTRNLISTNELGMMKSSAILINAARGGVVNESALVEALEANAIRGAATDVFSQEPPTPNNPLLNLSVIAAQKVFLTPHIAGITAQAWTDLFKKSWKNIQNYLDGKEVVSRKI
jgi:phosphoglycerate dehydrogenase-like enzyme